MWKSTARLVGMLYAIMAFAVGVGAQDLPSSAEAKEVTAEGKLVACSLEFTIAFRDQIYKAGSIAAVTGSINLWNSEGNKLHASFKLVGADIAGPAPSHFKVNAAHVFDASGKPHYSVPINCENENNFCAGMRADAFLDILSEVAERGSVRMAFNRKPGGMDVPVVLSVPPDVGMQLAECASNLASRD
jgi:hypothetical protein